MVTTRTPGGRDGAPGSDQAQVVPIKRGSDAHQPPDFLHTPRNEQYLSDLKAEAKWWDGCAETLSSKTAPFGFQRHLNRRLTGDQDRLWYETIVDYGQFKRGCVLGAGPGLVETELLRKMPELEIAVHDISHDSLGRLEAKLETQFPGRASFQEEDMNFISLPENTYDLVVAQSCIHHLLNLEHLAYEVNRALTPDGMFFMMDRVSETLYDFPEEKKRIFEGFLAMGSSGPQSRVHWPERENWHYSPFEGVRSGDILDVFGRYLNEVNIRTSSSLIELMLFVGPKGVRSGRRSLRERVTGRLRRELFKVGLRVRGPRALASPQTVARGDLLMYLDGFLCDSGALRPGLAFAVYRKRP